MAKRKLTINLPESSDALQHLLRILLQYGLISEKKARSIEQSGANGESSQKTKWALAAERLKSEGFLEGQGEESKKLTRDFREDFMEFCGVWTTADAAAFESSIEDFERVDSKDWQ